MQKEKLVKDLEKILYKYNFFDQLHEEQKLTLKNYSVEVLLELLQRNTQLVERKQASINFLPGERDVMGITRLYEEIGAANDISSRLAAIRTSALKVLSESIFDEKKAKETARSYFWKKFDCDAKEIAEENRLEQLKPQMAGIEFYSWVKTKKVFLEEESKKHIKDRILLTAQLKNESKYINIYLRKLSISSFKIKINEGEAEEIEVIYGSGKTRKGMSYSLSDGEKTALAFAYFLSKIRYEVIDNAQKKLDDYIVVVDDPVCSLDENRVFATAYVIKNMFGISRSKDGRVYTQNSKQLFVFSHNLVFLKFMGNILEKEENQNRADFYFENGNVSSLPQALQNYQTAYFYKMLQLIMKQQNTIYPIILELFLKHFCHLNYVGSKKEVLMKNISLPV
jgi:wobble nucleotide-excising tRNase